MPNKSKFIKPSNDIVLIKFIYSEKATKFLRNLHLFCLVQHTVKKRWRFRKIFVAFSEYMNFNSWISAFQLSNGCNIDVCIIFEGFLKNFDRRIQIGILIGKITQLCLIFLIMIFDAWIKIMVVNHPYRYLLLHYN